MQERTIEQSNQKSSKKPNASYPEIDRIGEDINSLKTNVSDLVVHVKEEGLNDLADATSGAYDNVAEFGRKLEKKIREQPAKSVAVAFAGGLLASYLLGRR